MVSNTTTERAGIERDVTGGAGLPGFVDWIVAACFALAGMALVLGGAAVTFAADRSIIARAIAEGRVVSDTLTPAQLTEVTVITATWTGIGLLVVGGVMVVGAVAYAVIRYRAHARAARGEAVSHYLSNALTGTVIAALLMFVPLSPAIGGAVAGYFERRESDRVTSVGALSGLIAMVPIAAIVAFTMVGVVLGMNAVAEGGLAIVVAVAMLFAVMVVVTIGAGLGAIGGYVGGEFTEK